MTELERVITTMIAYGAYADVEIRERVEGILARYGDYTPEGRVQAAQQDLIASWEGR